MTKTRIAGKPSTEAEAREVARVRFVAEYALRIHRLVEGLAEPTLPRPRNPYLADTAPVPPLSSSPSSPSSPALRAR